VSASVRNRLFHLQPGVGSRALKSTSARYSQLACITIYRAEFQQKLVTSDIRRAASQQEGNEIAHGWLIANLA